MALILTVKVVPKSKHSKCVLDKNHALKCYLNSPAEKGKANKELIDLFSKKLKVPKSAIQIVRGLTSRTKELYIETNLSFNMCLDMLGIERSLSLLKGE